METWSRQNSIHITETMLFGPAVLKRGLHPALLLQSHPIQWRSKNNKKSLHLKGWFLVDGSIGNFHGQHGLWIYQRQKVKNKMSMMAMLEKIQEGDFHSVTTMKPLCCYDWRSVRASAVNSLSGQTSCPSRGQPLASSTLCS